ncbi:hypothetical protein [Variovorax paradoxus]|uniref:hypothetical protein n=1 Tax=Variovorax paradoxus TaxID=34073 RepID=UPI001931F1E7|nr:hypothetical protein INQ48_13980 [Variovorax paradoxus]
MLKLSTGLRNYMLDTGALKAALAGGEIRIYAGTVPDTADAALGGATLLCVVKNGGAGINYDASAAGGVLAKAPGETWSGTNVATGTATFFRHVLASDDGTLSTTQRRIQGTLGTGGTDGVLTSVALVSGAPQAVDFYTTALPSG